MNLIQTIVWLALSLFAVSIHAAPGLVHRYNFEGGAARDSVGQLHGRLSTDAAFTQAPVFAAEAPKGAVGGERSILLDPVEGKRSGVLFNPQLLSAKAGSVAIWFKPTQGARPDASRYLFFAPPIPSGVTLVVPQNRNGFQGKVANSSQMRSSEGLRVDEWNHVVFTWSADGQAGLFLNGQLAGQSVFDPDQLDLKHFIRMGAFSLDANPGFAETQFRGAVYDLQIYDAPLDTEAVQMLHAEPGKTFGAQTTVRHDPASMRLAEIFSSGMVLQRNRPVVVWGEAAAGVEVTLRFAGQEPTGAANAHGRWRLQLDPLEAAAEGRSLVLESSDGGQIVLQDVVVGDVWLAAGQSNMYLRLVSSAAGKEALERSENPDFRFFVVPMEKVRTREPLGLRWQLAGPRTAGGVSAVAYFFGNDLQENLKIPVGIVQIAYGGSALESWVSPEALSVEKYPAYYQFLETREPAYLEPRVQLHPSKIREQFFLPYMPYSVRGVIWYQGESNNGRPSEYLGLWRSFREELRALFDDSELPIYTVQLARLTGANWSQIRLAQLELWQEDPNAFMAVTIDIPRDYNDGDNPIHPMIKKPVGERLARAARHFVYGEAIVPSGPVLREVTTADGQTRIEFEYAADGLATYDGEPLRGLYGGPRGVAPRPLMVEIKGDALLIDHQANGLQSLDIIRYGSESDMGAGEDFSPNLTNSEGLPASPFFYR